jgi:hypothetical protein
MDHCLNNRTFPSKNVQTPKRQFITSINPKFSVFVHMMVAAIVAVTAKWQLFPFSDLPLLPGFV